MLYDDADIHGLMSLLAQIGQEQILMSQKVGHELCSGDAQEQMTQRSCNARRLAGSVAALVQQACCLHAHQKSARWS